MSTTFETLLRTGARPSFATKAARAIWSAIAWPVRVYEWRQSMHLLGTMSDTELNDIGLVTQDLRDAVGLPIGHDPTRLLERRARERRLSRRL